MGWLAFEVGLRRSGEQEMFDYIEYCDKRLWIPPVVGEDLQVVQMRQTIGVVVVKEDLEGYQVETVGIVVVDAELGIDLSKWDYLE